MGFRCCFEEAEKGCCLCSIILVILLPFDIDSGSGTSSPKFYASNLDIRGNALLFCYFAVNKKEIVVINIVTEAWFNFKIPFS